MELLETNDPKLELVRKSAKHRQGLQDDVKLISEETGKIITNALIIGGTLAAAYFLARQFSGSKTKRKYKPQKIKVVQPRAEAAVEVEEESSPGILSQFGTALASQATVMLLSLAKDKLSDYLQSQFEKKAEPNERP